MHLSTKTTAATTTLVAVLGLAIGGAVADEEAWTGWGAGPYNNRWAQYNRDVNTKSVWRLQEHCRVGFPGGTSAAPVLDGSIAYFPTYNGSFVAMDYTTCRIQWQANITDIVLGFGSLTAPQAEFLGLTSRSSPQVDDDTIYLGTLAHALLVALDKKTGKLLDAIKLHEHPYALATTSPTLHNGDIFIGCASMEEAAAGFVPDYPCCSFIGNFVSARFDKQKRKFAVNWEMRTFPGNAGFSGGAVWGSQPAIDADHNTVFFGTGNTYRFPPQYESCEAPDAPPDCYPAGVHQESVLAVDIATGALKWATKVGPLDGWTVACGLVNETTRNDTLCPNEPGPDADFAMAPTLVPASVSGLQRDVLVIGQKNGILHQLDARTGELLWATVTGPGGTRGGMMWGIAADEARVYFAAVNSLYQTWQLGLGTATTTTLSNSAYGAAWLANGSLIWETQTPQDAVAFGPPTVAGDVVLVARTGVADGEYDQTLGGLVIMDKTTGEILGDMALDANFHGGITVQKEYVLFGTGYGGFNGTGSLYVMKVS